eukprot:2574489-Prymnesium_polylepis.1
MSPLHGRHPWTPASWGGRSRGRRLTLSRWASRPPCLVDASITLASHTYHPNSIALLWRRRLR